MVFINSPDIINHYLVQIVYIICYVTVYIDRILGNPHCTYILLRERPSPLTTTITQAELFLATLGRNQTNVPIIHNILYVHYDQYPK